MRPKMDRTDNLRIKNLKALISPGLLLEDFPLTSKISKLVTQTRGEIAESLCDKDDRLVVIVGPCSIHDPIAAMDYAQRLAKLKMELANDLIIIMRVYFEKPRTTVGWKGLINDPLLDGSFRINKGLKLARKLLIDINELGLPTGTEFLDTMIPQYISDLISWAAIGARTTESQIHRELTSGLSMPVGFKNGTTGNIQVATDAVYAASQPHHFLGLSNEGVAAIVGTKGNEYTHIILRGANTGPNYDKTTVNEAIELLKAKNQIPKLMIDCSHGNSNKDHNKQVQVIADLKNRIAQGEQNVFGLMIESHLIAGNQKLIPNQEPTYGQSITDKCIDWSTTVDALTQLAQAVQKRRKNKKVAI